MSRFPSKLLDIIPGYTRTPVGHDRCGPEDSCQIGGRPPKVVHHFFLVNRGGTPVVGSVDVARTIILTKGYGSSGHPS